MCFRTLARRDERLGFYKLVQQVPGDAPGGLEHAAAGASQQQPILACAGRAEVRGEQALGPK